MFCIPSFDEMTDLTPYLNHVIPAYAGIQTVSHSANQVEGTSETGSIANISDLQFFARITIYYSSRPELLLKVLNFGKSSRTRYVRNAEFSWLLRSEESDSDLIYHVVNLSQVDNERPAAVLSKSLVQRVTEAFHRLRFWKPAGGRRAGQDGQG